MDKLDFYKYIDIKFLEKELERDKNNINLKMMIDFAKEVQSK